MPPQWTDDAEQYRSINALFSNPPKSPLSPRAFFAPSVQRRQLPPPLSTAHPTSMFIAAFDGTTEEATVAAAAPDGAVERNTGKNYERVDRMRAARQIDRMSQRLRPTLQLVAGTNIDNVGTIGDEHREVAMLKQKEQQPDGEEGETGDSAGAVSKRARRISRRKLEHYDNSVAHIAPTTMERAKKEGSSAVVAAAAAAPTISTHQKDKQANDADSESNGSNRKQTPDAALGYSPRRNATETKYANERAPEDNRPDNMDADGNDNPDKGDPSGGESTVEQKKAANSNLPLTGGALRTDAKSEAVSTYIAEESGREKGTSATTATVTPSVQPQSRQYTGRTVRGEEGALDDNANRSGNDGTNPLEGNHNEPREEESSEEENLSRINHYSSSSLPPHISAEEEKNQNVSSLVSKVSKLFSLF